MRKLQFFSIKHFTPKFYDHLERVILKNDYTLSEDQFRKPHFMTILFNSSLAGVYGCVCVCVRERELRLLCFTLGTFVP